MDAVLLCKAGSLERCITRVRDRYQGHEAEFVTDIDLQDIVVLNLQRACQLAIDMALRTGRTRRLALPSDTAEIFRILAQAGLLTEHSGNRFSAWLAFATSPCTNIRSSTSPRSGKLSSSASTISPRSRRL